MILGNGSSPPKKLPTPNSQSPTRGKKTKKKTSNPFNLELGVVSSSSLMFSKHCQINMAANSISNAQRSISYQYTSYTV